MDKVNGRTYKYWCHFRATILNSEDPNDKVPPIKMEGAAGTERTARLTQFSDVHEMANALGEQISRQHNNKPVQVLLLSFSKLDETLLDLPGRVR